MSNVILGYYGTRAQKQPANIHMAVRLHRVISVLITQYKDYLKLNMAAIGLQQGSNRFDG